MHGKNKDKTFHITDEISFKWLIFFTVLARAVFRTQPEDYGGAFLQKYINNIQLLIFL